MEEGRFDTQRTVLLVEDNPGDARLIEMALATHGNGAYRLEWMQRLQHALQRLGRGSVDVVLLDLSLPDSSGYETFVSVREAATNVPIVVLTGAPHNEQAGIRAVRDGAQDYLSKTGLAPQLLVRSLTYAIERHQTQTWLAETLDELERSRDDMRSIINQLRIATAMTDEDGLVTFLSESGRHLLELGRDERVAGVPWYELLCADGGDRTALQQMALLPPDQRSKIPVSITTSSGKRYWTEVEVHDDPRQADRKMVFVYDLTELHDLKKRLGEEPSFRDIIGQTDVMKQVFQLIRDVAPLNWTVLIEGDTGTGKELVARAIHSLSPRCDKPFVPVNCAGLSDSLLASQLFGHRRGAFTGATADQKGLFEAAQGGTLFLDEIGDVSRNVQTSLLRVLEGGEITRLGETTPRQVDVRIVAATHRDLKAEVDAGRFREDLLYRIRVARITLPPLAHRREDILLLTREFLAKSEAAATKRVSEISSEALRKMLQYRWPGNVRELRSAIEFAIIHCRGHIVRPEDLPPEVAETALHLRPPLGDQQDQKERLLSALREAGGNRTEAAKLLGIGRATLYRHLAKQGIE